MKIGLDISVLSEANKTGVGVYTFELIKKIVEVGEKDKFVMFGLSYSTKGYDYLSNLDFGKNARKVNYQLPSKIFKSAIMLWQQLDYPPIDYFTGDLSVFHAFDWYIPPQKKGKTVVTMFDMTSFLFPDLHQPKTAKLDQVRMSRAMKKADLIVTISQSSKNDIQRIWPQAKISVVYPAASSIFSDDQDLKKSQLVLEGYNLEPGYVLSVATLEPRKNITSLIEAYLKANINKPLVLVGKEGWKNKKLLDLALRYPNRIVLTGYVPEEDLVVLYQNALCLGYPSFYEGFGLPPLEAMQSGTPVICSNTSSLVEVGGDAVYFINPNRVEEISQALRDVASDKKLRNSLIKQGLVQSQKFSWTKSARKLLDIYRNL